MLLGQFVIGEFFNIHDPKSWYAIGLSAHWPTPHSKIVDNRFAKTKKKKIKVDSLLKNIITLDLQLTKQESLNINIVEIITIATTEEINAQV